MSFIVPPLDVDCSTAKFFTWLENFRILHRCLLLVGIEAPKVSSDNPPIAATPSCWSPASLTLGDMRW